MSRPRIATQSSPTRDRFPQSQMASWRCPRWFPPAGRMAAPAVSSSSMGPLPTHSQNSLSSLRPSSQGLQQGLRPSSFRSNGPFLLPHLSPFLPHSCSQPSPFLIPHQQQQQQQQHDGPSCHTLLDHSERHDGWVGSHLYFPDDDDDDGGAPAAGAARSLFLFTARAAIAAYGLVQRPFLHRTVRPCANFGQGQCLTLSS